jgi:hypothetical protein
MSRNMGKLRHKVIQKIKISKCVGIKNTVMKIVNINNMQSNITQLMILLRCISYTVSFKDMFQV